MERALDSRSTSMALVLAQEHARSAIGSRLSIHEHVHIRNIREWLIVYVVSLERPRCIPLPTRT